MSLFRPSIDGLVPYEPGKPVEAGVVAIDAESTVETVADGIAPHPTLSEAIKEAGLVALGRAIHIPNRKPRAATPA